MEDITIQDLYNWAKDHNYLDYKIRIQYRDDGGTYFGYDEAKECYTSYSNTILNKIYDYEKERTTNVE